MTGVTNETTAGLLEIIETARPTGSGGAMAAPLRWLLPINEPKRTTAALPQILRALQEELSALPIGTELENISGLVTTKGVNVCCEVLRQPPSVGAR